MIDAKEWERELVNTLSLYVSDPDRHVLRPTLEAVDYVLEGEFPKTAVVFTFWDSRHPGCRFGYRWGPLWEWVVTDEGQPLPDPETPESLALIIWTNFDEARELRLPQEYAPDGTTTWVE